MVLLEIAQYLIICDYGIEVKSLSCIKFLSRRNLNNIKSSVSRSEISNFISLKKFSW